MTVTLTECPRCKLLCDMTYPALSRRDNKTAICSRCGNDEAIREWRGLPPLEF